MHNLINFPKYLTIPCFSSTCPFHEHFNLCRDQICQNTRKCLNTRRELCTINVTGAFTVWLVIFCVWTALSRTTMANLLWLLPTHEGRSESYLHEVFYPKGESWTISLLFFKFPSMADVVFFCQPFDKVKEMDKTVRDKWISDADVLSIHDCPESCLKQKKMWEHLKSGKLHTIGGQSYALEITVYFK